MHQPNQQTFLLGERQRRCRESLLSLSWPALLAKLRSCALRAWAAARQRADSNSSQPLRGVMAVRVGAAFHYEANAPLGLGPAAWKAGWRSQSLGCVAVDSPAADAGERRAAPTMLPPLWHRQVAANAAKPCAALLVQRRRLHAAPRRGCAAPCLLWVVLRAGRPAPPQCAHLFAVRFQGSSLRPPIQAFAQPCPCPEQQCRVRLTHSFQVPLRSPIVFISSTAASSSTCFSPRGRRSICSSTSFSSRDSASAWSAGR